MHNSTAITKRYATYPDITGKRQAEGGRRVSGEMRGKRDGIPLVTIITVCWNAAKTIEQTLQSVMAQTYKNIEHIVVDGNSTDATLDILRRYEGSLDYFVSEPDKGLYHAMNKGLELARGDYILMLNADDWYTPDAVEQLMAAQEYSGCDFVSALAQYVDADGKPTEIMRPMSYDASITIRMPLRHETMLIAADIYDAVGPYNETYRIIADSELTLRLFRAGYTNYDIPRALLHFRNDGVSNLEIDKRFKERARLIRGRFGFISQSDAALLADPRQITPDALAGLTKKYGRRPLFIQALQAYHRDRRRVSNVKAWRNSTIASPPAGKDDILVSVVMPVFKAEDALKASISSALSQSLKKIELICVNDASPDGSGRIIDEFAAKDDRVVHLVNPVNIGQGPSRNRGKARARGQYVFFLDSDDVITPGALKLLYDLAVKHDSDIVRGAFSMEQTVFGQSDVKKVRKGLCAPGEQIVNTNLADCPDLLRTTEGHWSHLYRANLAKAVPYHDLRIGQDSVFLIGALQRAEKITVTGETVYRYKANPQSVMNTHSFIKYLHALEWRRRAWHLLRDGGKGDSGLRFLASYWNENFIAGLAANASRSQAELFFDHFRTACKEAQITTFPERLSPFLRRVFPLILKGQDDAALDLMKTHEGAKSGQKTAKPAAGTAASFDPEKLRVATFCTLDHGGGGLGSQRRVEALRRTGVDAKIFCVFKKSDKEHVFQVPYAAPLTAETSQDDLRAAWRAAAVLTRAEHPGLKAREMFSKPGSVVDFRDLKPVFENADIVHMHWVAGLVDYDHTEELADKPVVWTFADMNAFTGGCHYSEGCEGYKDQCQDCPLLERGSDLAHKAWQKKRAAYAKIKNLHIICPSQWLADCAKASSLIGDREIHMIPNAFPVDRFTPTNKMVARLKLGLPLDKKLIVFGADSLNNRRKGGDILAASVGRLRKMGHAKGVEGVFFGSANLDLGIKGHNMGHISDERKLSLIHAAADVFAFPSREDNAPLTVAEALLSGTPVVAFPVGNVPEMITHKETGYIARYTDAADFAAGLAWALKDTDGPDSVLRGLRGHLHARTHNDPDTAISRHIALYHKMLAK